MPIKVQDKKIIESTDDFEEDKISFTITLPETVFYTAETLCEEEDLSMDELFAAALELYLQDSLEEDPTPY